MLPKLPVQEFVEVGERPMRAIWLWCRWEADEYFQQPESKLFWVVSNSVTRDNVCKPQHGKFRLDTRKDFHWKDETLGNGVCTTCETSLLGGLENSAQQSWYGWYVLVHSRGFGLCIFRSPFQHFWISMDPNVFFPHSEKSPKFILFWSYSFRNTFTEFKPIIFVMQEMGLKCLATVLCSTAQFLQTKPIQVNISLLTQTPAMALLLAREELRHTLQPPLWKCDYILNRT